MNPTRLVSAGALALVTHLANAGIGPENVVLVVNGDSQDSLRVAHAYIGLRQIPAGNVVVLMGLTGTEFTDVEGFRKQILGPVQAEIAARGLTKQIDCITYSVDIPYSVNVSGDIKGRKLSQVITPTASTNGLTYLMDWAAAGNIDYLRLDINTYCRRRTPVPTGAELTAAEQIALGEAMAAYDAKDYKKAIAGLEKLLSVGRTDPSIAYNLACSYALDGQKDAAVAALNKAVLAGWRSYGQTSSDPDFNSIKNRDDFQQLIDKMMRAHVGVQPSLAFQRSQGWSRTGEPDANGAKYMLSTFLGVTAGRGNTVDEIIESLKRAKSADFSSPKGTIYFERNGDVRSTTREWGFRAAADELNRLGVKAVVEDGILPKERPDVAGAMIGIADFNWPSSKSTILPGAIVEHLTSLGGMINKGAGQTACTEFIRAGAAGSSGTVTEPYALQEKFPSPFIHVHYAKGFTLAESFYMSLFGPYQLLIIGDPMCRPWAKRADVQVDGLPSAGALTKTVKLKPRSTEKMAQFELFVDGRRHAATKPGGVLALDPAKLSGGYHEVSVVGEKADSTAGKYRVSYPVVVGTKKVSAPDIVKPDSGGMLQFAVASPGAKSIELFHLGRSIGSCGASGTVKVSANVLGVGASMVYPVATIGTSKIHGKPIRVVIEP